METAIFEKAKYLSWQEQWPETTECVHCKEQAELILAVQEVAGEPKSDKEPVYICDKYENGAKSGEWWPHDCIAVATYFCRSCFGVTSKINQG